MTGRGTPGPAVTPSGFFVLRTPLLPFTEVTAWGDGLQAPAAAGAPGGLDQAVAADRAQLRRRLEDIVTTPGFRDALFVASPGLAAAADLWRKEPDSDKGRATERSLVSYVLRAAARPTPFGLFAGCTTGRIGERTCLRLGAGGRAPRPPPPGPGPPAAPAAAGRTPADRPAGADPGPPPAHRQPRAPAQRGGRRPGRDRRRRHRSACRALPGGRGRPGRASGVPGTVALRAGRPDEAGPRGHARRRCRLRAPAGRGNPARPDPLPPPRGPPAVPRAVHPALRDPGGPAGAGAR